MPFTFREIQFPVRHAFGMTTNKSQGQTLEKVVIFLPKDLFSHGQLYVAMSRVGARKTICIQVLGGGRQGHDGVFIATSSSQRLFSELLPACPLQSGAFIFSSFCFVLYLLGAIVRIWIIPAMCCNSFWQGCCILILLLGRMSSTGPCLLEHGTRSRQRHLQDSKIASLAKFVRAIARETY